MEGVTRSALILLEKKRYANSFAFLFADLDSPRKKNFSKLTYRNCILPHLYSLFFIKQLMSPKMLSQAGGWEARTLLFWKLSIIEATFEKSVFVIAGINTDDLTSHRKQWYYYWSNSLFSFYHRNGNYSSNKIPPSNMTWVFPAKNHSISRR